MYLHINIAYLCSWLGGHRATELHVCRAAVRGLAEAAWRLGRLSKLHPLVADRQLRYLWPGCNCGGCVGECAMDLLKIGRKSEETCFLEGKVYRKPLFYGF